MVRSALKVLINQAPDGLWFKIAALHGRRREDIILKPRAELPSKERVDRYLCTPSPPGAAEPGWKPMGICFPALIMASATSAASFRGQNVQASDQYGIRGL